MTWAGPGWAAGGTPATSPASAPSVREEKSAAAFTEYWVPAPGRWIPMPKPALGDRSRFPFDIGPGAYGAGFFSVAPSLDGAAWIVSGGGLYRFQWDDFVEPALVGAPGQVDPQLEGSGAEFPPAPIASPRGERPVDPLLAALEAGRAAEAVLAARREEARVGTLPAARRRLLALSLLMSGDATDAAEELLAAHVESPDLGASPMDPLAVGFGPQEWRKLVTRAVSAAHRAPSAESWLLAAALVQSEGRLKVASRLLERSLGAGLAEEIAGPLRGAVTTSVANPKPAASLQSR